MKTAAPPPGRSPLVAVLASFFLYFMPGAGQMYAGRGRRGLAFLFGTYAGAFALLYAQVTFLPGGARWLVGALLAAWWCFMAVDAYRCALESPPAIEDAGRAAFAGPFEPASPALRWTWAATRALMLCCGAFLLLVVLLAGLSAAAAAVKAGAPLSAAIPLAVAAAGAACLNWLAIRGRLVYAAAAGSAPLPADRLRGEVRRFAAEASVAGVFLAFCVFVTQGIWRDLYRVSKDGATRGRLTALRTAVQQARDAELGLAPGDLSELSPKFIDSVPAAELRVSAFRRLHEDSGAVRVGSAATDEGGWLYDAEAGAVFVNCTHTDSKLSVWSVY
ncbi:MAG: hypothetical protein HYZ75_09400 [Elusimicrobia bacterium]|nr:hypothetical protein [Elusimicrobiota bacterium]